MKPFAWSYSALSLFETCPKKYYHLNVVKDFKDEDSDVSREGKEIHLAMFQRVIKNVQLPLPQRHLEKMAARFAGLPGEKHGEMKLAVNRNLEPVAYFDPGVWLRVVIDFLAVDGEYGVMVDWKTGKRKPDFTQLGLSAAVLSRWMPELKTIKALYVWTSERKVDPKDYDTSDMTAVWNEYYPRVAKMEDARKTTNFPATPSGLCKKYCTVKSCPYFGIGSR